MSNQVKSEGERLIDFLTSTFYDIKRQNFVMLGLQVNQQQNGFYKIESVIDASLGGDKKQ